MEIHMLSNQNREADHPNKPTAEFRLWWSSYRSDMTMQAQNSPFIVSWWRDLRPSLRLFLCHESGMAQPDEFAVSGWEAISSVDQTKVLQAARLMLADLKPASWL